MGLVLGEDEVALALDGGGAEPTTVDARHLIRVAAAYFDLLVKAAGLDDNDLVLTGVEIKNKCAAIVSRASDRAVAASANAELAGWLRGGVDIPRGCGEEVKALKAALLDVPQAYRVETYVLGEMTPLARPLDEAPPGPWSTTTLRATLMHVGGVISGKCHARFKSGSEAHPFTLRVRAEQALALAPHLFQPLEIEARVARSHKGEIDSGVLTEFYKMDDGDPTKNWADWMRDAGAHTPDRDE